jgi:hypothetical protein
MNTSNTRQMTPYLDPCMIAAALMSLIPAVASAAGANFAPGQHDFMAALGAGPAAVIVLLYCQRKGRGLNETVSAFLASIGVGVIVPGAALWNWAPQFAQNATWHIWAAAGMFCALGGWALVLAVIVALELRAPKVVNDKLDHFLPDSKPNDDSKP